MDTEEVLVPDILDMDVAVIDKTKDEIIDYIESSKYPNLATCDPVVELIALLVIYQRYHIRKMLEELVLCFHSINYWN
jgi:hypothetical protein